VIEVQAVPPYVYEERSDSFLAQGDILKVSESFRDRFVEYYPSINHPEDEDKHVLVLTQSCDLVRIGKRKPKVPHINVCLVRPIERVLDKIIKEEIQPDHIGDIKLLPRGAMDQLKDRLSKLLNNNDQKMHFFLPKKAPFKQDMIALIHMSFSFRTEEHYDMLLKHRILSLKPEFQAKLGHIISQLYGRIATTDLSDLEWKDKEVRRYIESLLINTNLNQVPDHIYIEYIKQKAREGQTDINKLIEEYQIQILKEKFEPLKKVFLKEIKNRIMKMFEDPTKINSLEKMTKPELSKEINKIIMPSD